MNLISLDLSTKPGFAIFIDNKLIKYGTLWADKTTDDFGPYPWNYILLAQHTANRVYNEVIKPTLQSTSGKVHIVIEETTSGAGNNYSQKKLEFIHYAVLQLLQGLDTHYVRDGSWKSVAGVKLNDEEKKINKQIKEFKEKTGSKLAKLDLDGSGKVKVVGKITVQHVYIRRLKELFNIVVLHKGEDAAAAILMGYAFLKGVKLCDGKIKSKRK